MRELGRWLMCRQYRLLLRWFFHASKSNTCALIGK